MDRVALTTSLCVLLASCSTVSVPNTLGDSAFAPAFGYTPLDPLPVHMIVPTGYRTLSAQEKLDLLPDETMRLAIGKVQSSGEVTYGPASAGAAGNSYVVILDYIKCTTTQLALRRKSATAESTEYVLAGTSGEETSAPDVVMPVYVGVGLRLTATVTVRQGSVNLANLLAVGAAVKTSQATGTLVVQTLGLSGEGVSTAIPIPSELNETTIQNALMAIGAMKAKTYDPKTLVTPRIVGIYNSVGGGSKTVNGLVSVLLEARLEWKVEPARPAEEKEAQLDARESESGRNSERADGPTRAELRAR